MQGMLFLKGILKYNDDDPVFIETFVGNIHNQQRFYPLPEALASGKGSKEYNL